MPGLEGQALRTETGAVMGGGRSLMAKPGRGMSFQGVARLMFLLIFVIVGWITVVPFAMLIIATVSARGDRLPLETATFTLANYLEILRDPDNLSLFLNTAIFTVGATALGVGIAVFFAWLIERTDIWARNVFFVALLLPMAIPNMIYATSWIQLLGPNNGLITVVLNQLGLGVLTPNIFSLGSMIFVQGIALASHAYLLVAAPFRMIDPTWEEQSAIAGKRIFATFRRITLPVLKPALLGALAFFTVVSMETFDIPVMLGLTSHVHVLSTRIFWLTHPEGGQLPNYGLASVLSLVLIVVALAFIQLYHRQTRNARQFVTITGRGFRPRRIALGVWRLPLFLAAALFVFVAVLLPLFMLLWRSLLRFYLFPSVRAFSLLNLGAYRDVINDSDFSRVVSNTFIVAVTAGVSTVLIAALGAWLIVRGPIAPRWRRRLNSLAFMPQAVPAIVIGLALMLFYLRVPVPIYGTVWIIALGMTTKYLAYSTGSMIAAQMQVSSELEEASHVAGAGWSRTYVRIVAPLIAPALLSSTLWVVIHVIRELGLALMLYSLNSQVLSTKIWLLWESGLVPEACAVGILTVVALLILLAIPWTLRRLQVVRRRFREPRVIQPSIGAAFD